MPSRIEVSKQLAVLINECIELAPAEKRDRINELLEFNLDGDPDTIFDPGLTGSLVADQREMGIAICRLIKKCNLESETGLIWKIKSDFPVASGTDFFVLGIGWPRVSVYYCLPPDRWDDCYFARELAGFPQIPELTAGQMREFIKDLFL